MPRSNRPALSPRPPQLPANLKNTSNTRPLTFSPCESISSQGLGRGPPPQPSAGTKGQGPPRRPKPHSGSRRGGEAGRGGTRRGRAAIGCRREGAGPQCRDCGEEAGTRPKGLGRLRLGGRAAGVEGGATRMVGKTKSIGETAFGGQWVDGPEVMGFRNKGNRSVSWKTGNLFPSSGYKARHHFLHV